MKMWFLRISIFLVTVGLISCKQKVAQVKQLPSLPYYMEASFTPHWISKNSDSLNSFHHIPNFSLTNQNGQTITQKSIEGKIVVVDFFFTTCPGICPKMTANMAVLQDSFITNRKVILLSHSVTPETDSVPVLKDYAIKKGIISPQWHLLTGDRQQIYNLGRKAYFVEEDLGINKGDDDFLHTENFVLLDGNQHIRGIYNGLNKASVQQLILDIQLLVDE